MTDKHWFGTTVDEGFEQTIMRHACARRKALVC